MDVERNLLFDSANSLPRLIGPSPRWAGIKNGGGEHHLGAHRRQIARTN
jgi:hypothetical protein